VPASQPHPRLCGILPRLGSGKPRLRLQPFGKYQPVTPMVNAVRSALTGGTHDLAVALIWSAALILVCTPSPSSATAAHEARNQSGT
jgi:hypothetical protein